MVAVVIAIPNLNLEHRVEVTTTQLNEIGVERGPRRALAVVDGLRAVHHHPVARQASELLVVLGRVVLASGDILSTMVTSRMLGSPHHDKWIRLAKNVFSVKM